METTGNNRQMMQSSASLQTNKNAENQLIKHCKQDEIKMLLAYLFVLVGLKDSEIPQDDLKTGMLRKTVLINSIKKLLENKSISDIKIAFELAISKKIDVDLSLYGGQFSIKMVMEVVAAYDKYKAKNFKKADEYQMNNIQRLASIDSFLTEETKEKLKQLGAEKEQPKKDVKRNYDVFQKWMAHFDKLKRKFELPGGGGRYIRRYGSALNIEAFVEYKTEQLRRVTAYLQTRNQDIL